MSAITGGSAIGTTSNIKPSASGISSNVVKSSNITKSSIPSRFRGQRQSTGFNPSGATQQKFKIENLKKSDPKYKFDAQGELDNVLSTYERLIEQKMYADFIANMIGHEKENFDNWAESLNLKPTEIQDLVDFIDVIDDGNYTTSESLNEKINKVLDFIPDIAGALLKSEAIAPSVKVLQGKNPVIDEVKFTIEKVVAPLLKRVGTRLEKKFEGQLGKQMGKLMAEWGERLATLPTKILEKLGPADIVASVVDLGLLAVDMGTGNYRARNHDLPDEVLGIPIVGSIASGLMSVRDLLDTALGVPTNEEGVKIIRDNLYNNLWKPSMEEYKEVMEEIGGKAEQIELAKEKIEKQLQKEKVHIKVQETLPEAIKLYGKNNKPAIINFYLRELDRSYDPSIPPSSSVQSNINSINSEISKLNNDLSQARKDLSNALEEYGRGAGYLQTGARQRIKKAEEALKTQKAELESNKRLLEKSKTNEANKDIFNDVSSLVDLYLEEKDLETVKGEVEDLEEVSAIDEIISPVEIQGRQVLENLFSMAEQYRLGLGAMDNLRQQISNYDRDMFNASYIMTQGPSEVGWETWEMADRVYNEAEKKKPQAQAKLRELEGIIPKIEEAVNASQADLENIINYANQEGIDLAFLRQSPNYDEALASIQDDSKIWEDIFKGIASASRGFDPFMF